MFYAFSIIVLMVKYIRWGEKRGRNEGKKEFLFDFPPTKCIFLFI